MKLNSYFELIYVINLPERLDRRREMQQQLKLAALKADFFPATRVSEAGDWPSVGARGCYQSHLAILKEALQSQAHRVMVLEDDLDFSPRLKMFETELLDKIALSDWDILYLGHVEPLPDQNRLELVPSSGPIMTAHFYAVNARILQRLVTFLELVQSRPAGDPLGGPQHYDGALWMFRQQNPDVKAVIVLPSLGFQRSSRSDICVGWYDRIPLIPNILNSARRLRRFVLSSVKG